MARVCRVLGAPRSTVHYRRRHLQLVADGQIGDRPGPAGTVADDDLVGLIRTVIGDCRFARGGGVPQDPRPRRARVGQAAAALLRRKGLLAPRRAHRRRKPRLHDGRIVTDAPDVRWGTDATMAWTTDDGWVWVFDRLQPVYYAVIDRTASSPPMWPAASRSATTGGRSTARVTSPAR